MRLGAPRISSVFPLKDTPSTATTLWRTIHNARSILASNRSTRALLMRSTSWSIRMSTPFSSATLMSALRSLGRQAPPKPRPAFKKSAPMRGSIPMLCATVRTSTPSASHRSDITLMNEIFAARNAFAVCLMNSAVVTLVTTIGHSKLGLYRSSSSDRARWLSAPMTIRSGRMKSCTAEPSRRNSGLLATSNSCSGPASRRIVHVIHRAVRAGTVLFSTMSL